MENSRRALRTNNCCPSNDNIFSPLSAHPHLLQKIPPQVLKQAASTKLISCATVQSLPEFKMPAYSSQDVRKLREAANYQLAWQGELCDYETALAEKPTQIEEEKIAGSAEKTAEKMEEGRRGRGQRRGERKTGSIWEDQSFMERLQEFIVSDTYEDRTLNLLQFWG